jgi:protease-4
MAEAIASRQGITVDDARALIDGGPYNADAARKGGLVNRVAYADQVEAEVAKGLGLAEYKVETRYGKPSKDAAEMTGLVGFMKMMQALSGEAARKAAESKAPKVALIHASGLIETGRSRGSTVFGQAVLGSDTLIKNLRQAERDQTVKAIVLRIDSPGGSALASDLIWREVTRTEKPVVASMSDVAASGGYYISMGCDRIFAEPGTLTGSIGVISVKLAVGGLLEKLGVTTDRVTVGKNGTFNSPFRPWSDSEREAMRRLSKEVYRQFVGKAAKGRHLSFEQLEKKAGGRIYTGRQAKKEGLVDELGTVEDAIAAAKELAGMSRYDKTELLVLPKPQSVLESLLSPLEERDRDTSTKALTSRIPEPLRGPLARVWGLTELLSAEPAVLLAPYDLRVR